VPDVQLERSHRRHVHSLPAGAVPTRAGARERGCYTSARGGALHFALERALGTTTSRLPGRQRIGLAAGAGGRVTSALEVWGAIVVSWSAECR
jgi:hypothetical protein